MKLGLPVLCAGIACVSACTWVEPTKEGNEVLLVKAFNVQSCKHIGSTTSSVKDAIGPVTRSEEKVREELITLAKNNAAERGGDSIVAKGPVVNGSMSFDIFRCSD